MEPEAPNPVYDSASAEKQSARATCGRSAPGDSEAKRRTQSYGLPAVQKVRQAMAPTGAGGSASSAMLDGDQDGESLLADATANTRAMIETTNAIIRANTVDDVVRGSLDTIRKAFGWAYASYWSVDPTEHALVFMLESGRVDDEFQRHTRTAKFREGEGLNGRAWRQRELFFVEDLSQLRDCSRAPLASRAGIRSGIALPIFRDGQVIGTMDFFAMDAVEVSPTRLDALRTIAQLASDKASTLGKQVELTRIMQMVENAPVNMMSRISTCGSST